MTHRINTTLSHALLLVLIALLYAPFVRQTFADTTQTTQTTSSSNTLVGPNFGGPVPNKVREYTLLAPVPCVSGTGSVGDCKDGPLTTKVSDFQTYLRNAFRLAIALAAVLAVFMIIYGGFTYLSTDAIDGKNTAKDTIKQAIEGLLFTLGAFFILQQIDPRFVTFTAIEPIKLKVEKTVSVFSGLIDISDNQIRSAEEAYVASERAAQDSKNLREAANGASFIASQETDPIKKAQLQADAQLADLKATKAEIQLNVFNDFNKLASIHDLDSIQATKASMDQQYASGIQTLLSKSGTGDAYDLQNEQIRKDAVFDKMIASDYINRNLVNVPTKIMDDMQKNASAQISKISIQENDTEIEKIKDAVANNINDIISLCQQHNLSCKNYKMTPEFAPQS